VTLQTHHSHRYIHGAVDRWQQSLDMAEVVDTAEVVDMVEAVEAKILCVD
jgi:hypothetical protein